MLKHFKIDTYRDKLVPGLACYQADLMNVVDDAIKHNGLAKNWSTLPSWSKLGANVYKAKSLLSRTIAGIYLGQHGYDNLNIDYQLDGDTSSVDMFFFAAKKNKELLKIGEVFEQTLPNADVIVICGSAHFHGQRISNKNCEKFVKERVEISEKAGRKVIIIAKNMAQRSFGVGKIYNLFLCFDGGKEGTVIQKISRVLSPEDLDKVGRVFSLSFDPNRDDKIDSLLLTTAMNLKDKNPKKYPTIKQALGDVLKSVDIFSCTDDGAIKFTPDTYLEKAIARNSLSRAFGSKIKLHLLSQDQVEAVAEGDSGYLRNDTVDKAKTGDTRNNKTTVDKKTYTDNITYHNALKKAKEVCVTILENSDMLVLGTNSKSVHEGLDKIKKNKQWQEEINFEFGIDFKLLNFLFKNNIIEENWVSVLHDL
jgi:hypothetical protein